jgi:hypothetical protein
VDRIEGYKSRQRAITSANTRALGWSANLSLVPDRLSIRIDKSQMEDCSTLEWMWSVMKFILRQQIHSVLLSGVQRHRREATLKKPIVRVIPNQVVLGNEIEFCDSAFDLRHQSGTLPMRYRIVMTADETWNGHLKLTADNSPPWHCPTGIPGFAIAIERL